MVMVKMTILTMTIIPFLSSNGHGQIFKINRHFKIFNKFSANCADGHDQIWIDHFDHENFGILGMIMVKFGLITLTMTPRISLNS
jgi:hypothetical protein